MVMVGQLSKFDSSWVVSNTKTMASVGGCSDGDVMGDWLQF